MANLFASLTLSGRGDPNFVEGLLSDRSSGAVVLAESGGDDDGLARALGMRPRGIVMDDV